VSTQQRQSFFGNREYYDRRDVKSPEVVANSGGIFRQARNTGTPQIRGDNGTIFLFLNDKYQQERGHFAKNACKVT
jgi:hypothetical protein